MYQHTCTGVFNVEAKNSITFLFKNGTISIVKFRPKEMPVRMYQHTCTGTFNVEAKNSIILLFKNETISIVKVRPKKICQYKYVSTYLHWHIQR